MTAVVLGSTGGIGGAVVRELRARGGEVRAVSRSGELASDVSTPDGASRAVAGATVVYHCAQPPYTGWQDFPALSATIADATARAGARLVMADNLYMYGPPAGPLREDTPQRASDTKGTIRRQMAADLLARHDRGDLPVALGRASDYYGPGGTATGLGDTLFGRAVAGKKAQWIGRLDQPHTMHYLPDIARGLVTLGTHPDAPGRAWHLPAAPALTGRSFLDLVNAELERAGRSAVGVSVAGPAVLRLGGIFVAMLRELRGVAYQWQQPWVIDAAAFETAFGSITTTPHEQAVRETVAWWVARAG